MPRRHFKYRDQDFRDINRNSNLITQNAMYNIFEKITLPKWETFKDPRLFLSVAAGVIAVVVIILILIVLRRRKSKKPININFTDSKEGLGKKQEESYELVIKQVKRVKKKYKSILFASVEPESLPITILINTAIGLAKNEKRCLLIDVDLKRNAIAEAFGLGSNENSLRPKAVRTEFENLWVWPGHNFVRLKQMNIKTIVQKASEKFDFILINAPSLVSSPDRRQIISAAQAAFICTKNGDQLTKLIELIKPSDCIVIGHIQISL